MGGEGGVWRTGFLTPSHVLHECAHRLAQLDLPQAPSPDPRPPC